MDQGKGVPEERSGRQKSSVNVIFLRGRQAARGPASHARPGNHRDMPEMLQQAAESTIRHCEATRVRKYSGILARHQYMQTTGRLLWTNLRTTGPFRQRQRQLKMTSRLSTPVSAKQTARDSLQEVMLRIQESLPSK